jgi:hypothetical protein
MVRMTICLIFLFLSVSVVLGQVFEPLDLAKKIYGRDSFPDLANYIKGEYEGKPNGSDLPPDAGLKFLLLGQTENKAVVAMTILNPSGKGLDTYLHFEKDTIWKMIAFRSLAMTGLIEGAVAELEKMTPQQVEEHIKMAKKHKGMSVISSRDDYEFELGNGKLTIDLDDNIIKHFLANKAAFERIRDLAYKELETKKPDEENATKLVKEFKAEYRKLFISLVSYGGYETGDCLRFLIGGMLDNTVGYIYVKDKKQLPEMNDARIIMVREIGDGWYIYKTT